MKAMDRVKAIFQTARLALAGGFLLAAMAGAGAADRIAFVVPSATVYPGQIVSDTALLEKRSSSMRLRRPNMCCRWIRRWARWRARRCFPASRSSFRHWASRLWSRAAFLHHWSLPPAR
ncbi:conserved hypothetical protein [Brucella sp. NVSL 07-0026]|nr:conserved hypothetical protein [Brucella sp. NVSL 07-0026]